MRSNRLSTLSVSLGVAAVLLTGVVGCGSDDDAAVTSSAPSTEAPTDPVESSAPTATDSTESSPAPTDATDSTESSVTGPSATSDDLQDYVDSLAATSNDFDGLTRSPEETMCVASAFLTPIGVDALQEAGVSVEDINDDLDLELLTGDSAAAIVDGLVDCGAGPRFAAALARGEVTDDLDEAQAAELIDCVSPKIDDSRAREILVDYLTPSNAAGTVPDQYGSAQILIEYAEECGYEGVVYP